MYPISAIMIVLANAPPDDRPLRRRSRWLVMEMMPVIARDFDKCFVRSEQLGGHRSRCFVMEQKRPFLKHRSGCASGLLVNGHDKWH
jgi:hypothetical protein